MKTIMLFLAMIIGCTLQAQEVKLNIPKQKFELKGMQYAGLGLLFIGGGSRWI